MSDDCVEALALAQRRVVAAKARVARYEDFRAYLLQIGEVDAATRFTSQIRALELDLAYLGTVLIARTAKVYHEFNTGIARGAG